MTLVQRTLLLLVMRMIACGVCFAQVTTGTPPFGTVDSASGPDAINLANLNAHIAIPVIHKAGRGLNFSYDLSYDNSIWYPVTSGSTTTWQPVYNWGWRSVTEASTGYTSYSTTSYHWSSDGRGCYLNVYANWVYHDAWGIPHPFPGLSVEAGNDDDMSSCGTCGYAGQCVVGGSDTSSDGSGFSVTVPDADYALSFSVNLHGRDGKEINAPGGTNNQSLGSTDRNGNYISVNSSGQFFDTLSGTTPVLTVSGSGTPTSSMKFTYAAPSGAQPYYELNYTSYTVATHFGVSGISEHGATAENLISSIVLPDGTQYTITYEVTPGTCTPLSGTYSSNCVTGRIKSVTLPTGGSITYTYTGGSNGIFSDGSTSGLTRALSDGANWSATWAYSRTLGSGKASTTTITDPSSPANQTVIQFQGIYETQRQVYQGTSTLLQTVNTCYNGSASPCTGTAVTLPIPSQTVTTILPGAGNWQSKVATTYNSYGQLTEEDDYPYGSGAPGTTAIRKKLITIQTVNTYHAIQTAQIQDGSGNVLAKTTMTFDETTPTTPSGTTPQHTNVGVSRGNPTTINYWVNGVMSLIKNLTFFDTGNVQSIKDVNSATTTYTYPDTTSTCGNSFPTGVTEPISGLSQSYSWNCTGGVATSAQDENGKTISTSYSDTNFWRPASTNDQLSNQTNFTYTGQTAVESSLNFNGSTSTSDTLVTLDGLGRTHITQRKQGQGSSSYDSVETDYDAVGRPYKVTMPYSAAAGQTCTGTCPATTTTYDALGRVLTVTDAGYPTPGTVSYTYSQNDVYQTLGPQPSGENTKRKQMEYDALGRLTSVCEITSGTGSGTCAQNSSQTGFWTKYTYDANGNLTGVTQNAQAGSGQQQTRSYTYDRLSRLASETNPETGTMVYYYDIYGDCGTASGGDLVEKVDQVGDKVCYFYDALHRNTSITYPSGTYSSVTPRAYFVYDGATVNGTTMSNAKTRLAEAYTCYSPCTSKITDAGFSYTARGEVNDEYESTPHSSGYYHLSEVYWANGAPNQLNASTCSGQPCFSVLPMFTYGADGEGRTNTVSASSGQNPVTGTTYNLYSSPPQTTVSFGSGDSDVFNFDPNTGRATQYKFNVGATPQSVVGTLGWNANGSLGSLGITDPFNSSDAQSCTYAHDDLTRIASASCGSIWGQTFSFDAFGNINKTGNSSFSASYAPATNRMTMIGSSTPTYDANGNVTNDFLHTYAWDANGRPVTIDTITATYDALGRMVELYSGGTYSEIVYAPTGDKLAVMSGQGLTRAFVPLPGGAAVVYTSSGLNHYRHSDWLGSARLATTPSQTVYGDVAYAPYGETYAASGSTDFSWTGINADAEPFNPATLYDFPAREYGIQGRWPSPDPLGLGAVDPSNPQSWNRYAYVMNDPLAMTDPNGECPECIAIVVVFGVTSVAEFIKQLFGLFGHPNPHAPPAPDGGYGAGIDAYGTWDEQVPAGVQVFPGPFGSIGADCTYGSGNCGGMIYGFQDVPPQVLDPNFWIRAWVFGYAIYESAKIATSQAAHNAYNAAKSYVKSQIDRLSQNSGRQAKCYPIHYNPQLQGCNYYCDDGTRWFESGSCKGITFKPWGDGFPAGPPIPTAP